MNFPLDFPPGFIRASTEYASKGFWYVGNLVRWVEGVLQPVKGWRTFSTTTMTGMGRSIIAWKSGALAKLAAIGTHSKLYTMNSSGVLTNITPLRDSGTLGTDPFAVTNGDTTVVVTDTSHGLTVGDTVNFSGATAGGGITISGDYTVTVVTDANTYEIEHSAQATSTDSTTGGASVAYKYEISPGLADSASSGGYGYGLYGAGAYGTPRTGYGITTEARVWALDTFGQYLVAAPGQSGDIYEWQLNTANRAAKISNSPTALAIVVTDEAFLFSLGSGGNPRNVAWCDQGVNTTWTPAATNQAGDKDLQTFGKIVCGRKVKGATLVHTDQDVHRFTYEGGTFIFRVERIGDGCGIIAPGAGGTTGNIAVWMGFRNFWIYDGFVRPLTCPVSDYVFPDLNELQRAKVSCRYDSAFGEFTWYYPSSGSTENDRYVRWHQREGNVWTFGEIVRLSGCDRGTYLSPMAVGSDGYVYEHEVGLDYDDDETSIASAPIELSSPENGIGPGDRVFNIRRYVPDEKTSGDLTLTIYTRNFPNTTETAYGPYEAASPRDLRIQGRQIRIEFTGARMADWRLGSPRLEMTPGPRR